MLAVVTLSSCGKDGRPATINIFSIEDDKTLGAQVEEEIAADPATYPLLKRANYAAAYEHLDRITNAILNSGEVKYADEFDWSVNIVRDDSTLNAFCAPGGKIYVYTGIIRFLDSEDQLAGVMAHEIAHADLRHTTQQLTKLYGVDFLLGAIFGTDRSQIADIAASLVLLSYSRNHESQSDDFSVRYLYPTEYDARGAARFFEKLIEEGATSGVPEFLSTHPNPDNRVEAIHAKWQELGGKEGGEFPDRYQDFKNSLP